MNCNQQLKRYRKQKAQEEKMHSMYQIFHILALLTLYEDLNFRKERIHKFADGLLLRLEAHQRNELTYEKMVEKLNEYGMYLQGINWDGK